MELTAPDNYPGMGPAQRRVTVYTATLSAVCRFWQYADGVFVWTNDGILPHGDERWKPILSQSIRGNAPFGWTVSEG